MSAPRLISSEEVTESDCSLPTNGMSIRSAAETSETEHRLSLDAGGLSEEVIEQLRRLPPELVRAGFASLDRRITFVLPPPVRERLRSMSLRTQLGDADCGRGATRLTHAMLQMEGPCEASQRESRAVVGKPLLANAVVRQDPLKPLPEAVSVVSFTNVSQLVGDDVFRIARWK